MKDRHIAILGFPYASGVNPTLSVVRVLVRRGFRVSYVTSDHFARRVGDLGAEVILCPHYAISSATRVASTKPGESQFVTFAEQTLPALRSFYEVNRPNLVVFDFLSLAGRVLSTEWGIPSVQMSPALALSRTHLLEQLRSVEYCDEILHENHAAEQFFEKHGIQGNFPFHVETLNLYFYPECFQLSGNEASDRRFYAPRCAGEQPYDIRGKRPGRGDRRTVIVSASTLYHQGMDYFRVCIDALRDMDVDVVLAIGSKDDPSELGPLPAGFRAIQNASLIQLLPYAELLIFFAGTTSTMEALYHGVCLLMISSGFPEAELYADNVARLGLGFHMRKRDATPENVREFAERIFADASLLERVRNMQRLIQHSPGGEETVNRLSEHLADT